MDTIGRSVGSQNSPRRDSILPGVSAMIGEGPLIHGLQAIVYFGFVRCFLD